MARNWSSCSNHELSLAVLKRWERLRGEVSQERGWLQVLADESGVSYRALDRVRHTRNRIAHPDPDTERTVSRDDLLRALEIIKDAECGLGIAPKELRSQEPPEQETSSERQAQASQKSGTPRLPPKKSVGESRRAEASQPEAGEEQDDQPSQAPERAAPERAAPEQAVPARAGSRGPDGERDREVQSGTPSRAFFNWCAIMVMHGIQAIWLVLTYLFVCLVVEIIRINSEDGTLRADMGWAQWSVPTAAYLICSCGILLISYVSAIRGDEAETVRWLGVLPAVLPVIIGIAALLAAGLATIVVVVFLIIFAIIWVFLMLVSLLTGLDGHSSLSDFVFQWLGEQWPVLAYPWGVALSMAFYIAMSFGAMLLSWKVVKLWKIVT